jgi:DNA-binding NarL/FixJ family response regulator
VAQDAATTILLASRHALFRQALRVALHGEAKLEVVAEAADGVGAVEEAVRLRPNVILVEAELPRRDGLEVTKILNRSLPVSKVLVLTDRQDVRLLTRALEAGASGCLAKDQPIEHLVRSVLAVAEGRFAIPDPLLAPLIEGFLLSRRQQVDAFRRLSRLTPREREVLRLLADGGDNHSIARSLVISPETARTHVQKVLSKLHVHSRLEAAAFVAANGIATELEPVE